MSNNVYSETLERLSNACVELIESLKILCRIFTETTMKAFQRLIECGALVDALYVEQYRSNNLGSMRVLHLALHAKKYRVRKKNMNRIRKAVESGVWNT